MINPFFRFLPGGIPNAPHLGSIIPGFGSGYCSTSNLILAFLRNRSMSGMPNAAAGV